MKGVDRLDCPVCKKGRIDIFPEKVFIVSKEFDCGICKVCKLYFALTEQFAMIQANSLDELKEFGTGVPNYTSKKPKKVKKTKRKKK